jgi:predicted Zn-dependent protease
VIFSKLIDEAVGPHEVAAVLAHEIGHVVRYHSMKQLLRHYGMDLLMKIVTGGVSGSVTNVVSAAELLLILRNGRDAEREADTVGLELIAKAGWRQDGLAEFFGRLMKEPGGDAARRAGIFSSHPPTEERIAATKRPPNGAMPLSDVEWKALRAICR